MLWNIDLLVGDFTLPGFNICRILPVDLDTLGHLVHSTMLQCWK
jgi:hypothetical protein